jgi:hypothetical protein
MYYTRFLSMNRFAASSWWLQEGLALFLGQIMLMVERPQIQIAFGLVGEILLRCRFHG